VPESADACGPFCAVCPPRAGALPRCVAGECGFECRPGFCLLGGALGGACVPDDDSAHCGDDCRPCAGATPVCRGRRCVCRPDSCPAEAPVCGEDGRCRPCAAHRECAAGFCSGGWCLPPEAVAHVRADCAPGGDGSPARPFCTVFEAQGSTRPYIVVGPGRYAEALLFEGGAPALVGLDPAPVFEPPGGAPALTVRHDRFPIRLAVRHVDFARASGADVPVVRCTGSTERRVELRMDEVLIAGGAAAGVLARDCHLVLRRARIEGHAGAGLRAHGGSLRLENVLVAGNGGSGLDLEALAADSALVHVTAAGNGGAGMWCLDPAAAVNAVIWGNRSSDPGACTFATSLVQDLDPLPPGCTAADPRFAGPTDYRLAEGSPARDTARPLGYAVEDLAGTARPQGRGPDMGCYEQ
jgi:hypothetical protein